MLSNRYQQIAWVFASLLIGMMLQILPMPSWFNAFRPEWVFVIFLFWVLRAPHWIGVCFAFFLGIFMDLLMNTLLGQHALAYVIVTYIVIKLHAQIQNFSRSRQMAAVFVLSFLFQLLQNPTIHVWSYWLPALTSAIIWPCFLLWLTEDRDVISRQY